MIMKDMVISITGVQQGQNAVEMVTQGQYGVERDKICLSYDESALTGMEGTRTSITVSPNRVEMQREGRNNSQMIFQEGEKHYFLYETPFGSATMGLNTNLIRSTLGEHGGDMLIDYVIDMEHTVVGRSRFYIRIREPEKSHIGDIKWPI